MLLNIHSSQVSFGCVGTGQIPEGNKPGEIRVRTYSHKWGDRFAWGYSPLYKLYNKGIFEPKGCGLLSRIGLKADKDFNHFGVELGGGF